MANLFQLLPWTGGLNTSLDEAMIPPNQLTIADQVIFDTRGSRKKRDGIKNNWDDVTTGTINIIGMHDFWYGTTSRTQVLVSIGDNRTFKQYTGAGVATAITDAGTAWSGTLTNVCMRTYNNLLIMAASGTGNVLKKWSGSGNIADLDGTPPQASILHEHMGRLFTNDKTNVDRFHYSPVHDHTLWNGAGDSGAMDVGIGDGDPSGITAIFSFRGDLFVGKQTKLYRIQTPTNDPADWAISIVSKEIGVISHNSVVPIGQDDVFFVSERGVHSLAATNNYGDFENSFVSVDIQKTFRDTFAITRLKYSWGAYDSTINSIAFAFTENTISSSDYSYSQSLYGSSAPVSATGHNAIWLYNIPLKSWYRWGGTSCQSLVTIRSSDKVRFFLGTHISRISKTKNGTNYDISHAAANVAIPLRIKTGIIFPENKPGDINLFSRLYLVYKPAGTHTLDVTFKVDNQTISNVNQLSFSSSTSNDLLGSTFILGSSVLGFTVIMGSYSFMVEGVGRGFQVDITQNGIDQAAEIQGLGINYTPMGPFAEVF